MSCPDCEKIRDKYHELLWEIVIYIPKDCTIDVMNLIVERVKEIKNNE